MTDDKCIFCKIANGEIPSATVYEDDMFRVILDLGPATRGHALILPKNHFADVCALDEKTAIEWRIFWIMNQLNCQVVKNKELRLQVF